MEFYFWRQLAYSAVVHCLFIFVDFVFRVFIVFFCLFFFFMFFSFIVNLREERKACLFLFLFLFLYSTFTFWRVYAPVSACVYACMAATAKY